jgi:uncharacterized membrane-anchored protein
MKRIHVPQVNARYWLAITLASLFGTNLGDLYAHSLSLGLLQGLGLLALLVAGVFLLERRDHRLHEAYYWLTIILIRTGATNIADFLAYRSGLSASVLGVGLTVLLGLLAWWMARSASADKRAGSGAGLPSANAVYWTAMLVAGVLGTVLGDDLEHFLGDGPAALSLAAILGFTLLVTRGWRASVLAYWAAVAVARTAGTALGDGLADGRGLPLSTLLTGSAFVAVLLLWRSWQTAPVASSSRGIAD